MSLIEVSYKHKYKQAAYKHSNSEHYVHGADKKDRPTTEFTGFLLANAYFTAIFQFLLRIRVETYMYTQNVFNIFSCFQILCHYTMSQ